METIIIIAIIVFCCFSIFFSAYVIKMGVSQSSTYQPSITGLSKKDGNLVFKKIDDTEESIPIDTVSIKNVVVDSEGKLIITRTNGDKDGPFDVKGPKGDIGPSGPKGDIGQSGPKGSDSTVSGPQGPPGTNGPIGGKPEGQGMYAIWNVTCYNDDIFPGKGRGCAGDTNFINQQGGGSGGFRFVNFNSDNKFKNVEMETDGVGNLKVYGSIKSNADIEADGTLIIRGKIRSDGDITTGGTLISRGRDIVRELDELYINLNNNFVKKNENYRIQSRKLGNTNFVLQNDNGIKWANNNNGDWEAFRLVDSNHKA